MLIFVGGDTDFAEADTAKQSEGLRLFDAAPRGV
jgi:hypothetical protein